MSDYGKQIFHGLCPYTGESCETFECGTCKVEADEQLWLKEFDNDYDDLKHMLVIEPLSVTLLPAGTMQKFEETFGRPIRKINASHQDEIEILRLK